MSEHSIEFESEMLLLEDAVVTLHKIKSNNPTALSPMHTHRYFELLVVVEDAHICQTAHGDITVQKGELLILSPTTQHRICHDEQKTPIVVLGIEVSAPHGKGRFYEYLTTFLQTHTEKPLPLPNSLFHKFINYYLAPARRQLRQVCERKGEACDILAGLLGLTEQTVFSAPTTTPDIILETLVFSKDVSLAQIAAQLGYSQRQVQRKIQARYGKSLRQLRRENI